MKWILAKQLDDIVDIERVEERLDIILPKDFKEVVKNYNGASPEKEAFDTDTKKERVFERLLHFNLTKKGNILEVLNWVKSNIEENVYPFGEDPFGNYICFDYRESNTPKIVFWDRDINRFEFVANSFEEFLNKLYD